MNCKTARNLFSMHIDRCISYEEERKLMQHFEDCPTCAAEYKGVERTVGWVRELPEIPPSETFLQDVILAAREAREQETVPQTPGLGERIREFLAGLTLASSPLVAPAALVLGLGVGLGGTMIVLNGLGNGNSEMMPLAGNTVIEEVEPPAPSGPFDDLVQDMLKRVELESSEAEETQDVPDLEWGPPLDAGVQSRQVGTSTETWRDRGTRHRKTVVF